MQLRMVSVACGKAHASMSSGLRSGSGSELVGAAERLQPRDAAVRRLGVGRRFDGVRRLVRNGRVAKAQLVGVPRELDEALQQVL